MSCRWHDDQVQKAPAAGARRTGLTRRDLLGAAGAMIFSGVSTDRVQHDTSVPHSQIAEVRLDGVALLDDTAPALSSPSGHGGEDNVSPDEDISRSKVVPGKP